MSSLLSWHEYWVFNISIAFGFIITKLLSELVLKEKVSQFQHLKFARIVFITTIIIFAVIPAVLESMPDHQQLVFQLQPLIKHAAVAVTHINHSMQVSTAKMQLPEGLITLTNTIIVISIILGFKYIREMMNLLRLTKQAYPFKKINTIRILFSESSHIPFCWSTIFSSYIVVPVSLAEKRPELRLAIRHELQHIRQGDTRWLHLMSVLKMFSFWNPFIYLWRNLFGQLQEFSCDEVLILNQNTSPISYAQCLIDTARCNLTVKHLPVGVLGLSNHYQSMLKRRVSMLFQYKILEKSKISVLSAYATCMILSTSMAFAFDQTQFNHRIASQDLQAMISKSNIKMTIEPEVLTEINNIRTSEQSRSMMLSTLNRMKLYKPYISSQLKLNNLPDSLLALPFVESGYRPLDESKNRMRAAGIWQFIPDTAREYGLNIEKNHDERLDTHLETKAAVRYLTDLYSKYHDWSLAVIAYEYGDEITDNLIKKAGSHDAWVLARSSFAPADLKQFLTRYESSVLIIHDPKTTILG